MLFITENLPAMSGGAGTFSIEATDAFTVRQLLSSGGFVSLIENKPLCSVLHNFMQVEVPVKVLNVAPRLGEDTVILVQVQGEALAEKATQLGPNTTVVFSVIKTKADNKQAFTAYNLKKGLKNWLMSE